MKKYVTLTSKVGDTTFSVQSGQNPKVTIRSPLHLFTLSLSEVEDFAVSLLQFARDAAKDKNLFSNDAEYDD